jgi:hypothetical protein
MTIKPFVRPPYANSSHQISGHRPVLLGKPKPTGTITLGPGTQMNDLPFQPGRPVPNAGGGMFSGLVKQFQVQTLQTLRDNLPLLSSTGVVSFAQVAQAASNPRLPDHVRSAAAALLRDPELMAKLDVAGGGARNGLFCKTNLDALKAELSKPLTQVVGIAKDMSFDDAAKVLQNNFAYFDNQSGSKAMFGVVGGGVAMPDGLVNASDLFKVSQDANAPAELRRAAQTLLDSPEFEKLETRGGGRADAKISLNDVNLYLADRASTSALTDLRNTPRGTEVANALETLLNRLGEVDRTGGFFGGNGCISKQELTALLDSPDASLRKAAQTLLKGDSDALLKSLDLAAHIGGADGQIGKEDLQAALAILR